MIRRPCLAVALILVSVLAPPIQAQSDREDNILILDDVAVANLGIETVEVMETEFVSTVFAIGRTEEIPSRRSSLSSRIAGRVKRIDVFEGDAVIKGQVLATIESRQPGNPPPSISLKAPADGLVIHSHIHLGEPVTPDSDLMEISDRRRLWAVAKIPERDVPALKPGKTRARIRIPALGDERIEATLVRFGVVADRLAGTLDGIFELPNEDLALQPGMRAEFSIITEVREWVTAVPREAMQRVTAKKIRMRMTWPSKRKKLLKRKRVVSLQARWLLRKRQKKAAKYLLANGLFDCVHIRRPDLRASFWAW
ncbi:MAG: efflux RND transporter periplasmic adaptor subunit [Verrucomicrobiota bacterium]